MVPLERHQFRAVPRRDSRLHRDTYQHLRLGLRLYRPSGLASASLPMARAGRRAASQHTRGSQFELIWGKATTPRKRGQLMSKRNVGCFRILRGHGRPGLQTNFSLATGPDSRRRLQRSHHRRSQSRAGRWTSSRSAPRTAWKHHGGLEQAAFEKMISLLRYVDGDYADPATFTELRKQLGKSQAPLHYLAVPPSLFGTVAQGLQKAGCANNARVVDREAFRPRPALRRWSSTAPCTRSSPRKTSTASITTWARSRCRTSSTLASPTPSSSPSGTATTCAAFRSPWRRISASSDRGKFYDETGALRDVVQNHMLQVLANLTMDPPTGEDHEADRDSKAALLKAVRPLGARRCRARPVQRLQAGAGRRAGFAPSRPSSPIKLFHR